MSLRARTEVRGIERRRRGAALVSGSSKSIQGCICWIIELLEQFIQLESVAESRREDALQSTKCRTREEWDLRWACLDAVREWSAIQTGSFEIIEVSH